MKVAVTVISGVCMGLLMAFNGLNPLLQAKAIFEHRKRVLFSAALFAAGFTFLMAAVILAAIDLALQWEVQGFVVWEAILKVAAGFAVLALTCFITAKLIFPKANTDMFSALSQQAGFGSINIAPLIEAWLASLQPSADTTSAPAARQENRSETQARARSDIGIDSQVGLIH